MRYTSRMKDMLIIFGTIVAIIVAGACLYLYGPTSFRSLLGNKENTAIPFRLLKEGTDATAMTDRANYVIRNGSELNQLWGYIGATPGTAPNIDFTEEEVLAVFDGTHSTGGFRIQVTGVTNIDRTRSVQVTRVSPGANCITPSVITGPYQIIVVPKSDLPLAHIDTSVVENCP